MGDDLSDYKVAIVFGGAGFIGTHLLRALSHQGTFSRLISADRSPPRVQVDGVEYLQADVREPIMLDSDLTGADVYNLAAVHTTPGHEDWEYFWINVSGAIEVCRFATRIGAASITFTSSISVYGPSETPVGEDGPFRPDSAYGRSKLLAERIHQDWRNAAPGRKLTIVRPAVIFGAGEGGNFTRLGGLLKRGRFIYPGRTDTIKACAYVGELVRSMLFARGHASGEVIYNMAYPQRYTTADICQAMCEVGGYRVPAAKIPLSIMMLGGLAFEVLDAIGLRTSINRPRLAKLVHSTNIVPTRLEQLGYRFETDLKAGLQRWRTESPTGDFV